MTRAALALLSCLAALACAPATTPRSAAADPRDVSAGESGVLVYFPAGDCTGELELELYDRASGTWRPHPTHPRLPLGACAREAPEQLLNELRVRCADPAGERPPSEWVVGAALSTPAQPCVETHSR